MMKKLLAIGILSAAMALYGASDRIVARIATTPVWESEVKERAESRKLSFEDALNQIIDETLILAQAEKEGIEPSTQAVDEKVNQFRKRFSSETEFIKYLSANGATPETYRKHIVSQMKIDMVIRAHVISRISPTLAEIAVKMAGIPKGREIELLQKSFPKEDEASAFVKKYSNDIDGAKNLMTSIGWVQEENLDPDILREIEKSGKDRFTPVIKAKTAADKYSVFILEGERTNSVAESYERARRDLYEEKYNMLIGPYLAELRSSIPVTVNK